MSPYVPLALLEARLDDFKRSAARRTSILKIPRTQVSWLRSCQVGCSHAHVSVGREGERFDFQRTVDATHARVACKWDRPAVG
jgi:hypothetical protein